MLLQTGSVDTSRRFVQYNDLLMNIIIYFRVLFNIYTAPFPKTLEEIINDELLVSLNYYVKTANLKWTKSLFFTYPPSGIPTA